MLTGTEKASSLSFSSPKISVCGHFSHFLLRCKLSSDVVVICKQSAKSPPNKHHVWKVKKKNSEPFWPDPDLGWGLHNMQYN